MSNKLFKYGLYLVLSFVLITFSFAYYARIEEPLLFETNIGIDAWSYDDQPPGASFVLRILENSYDTRRIQNLVLVDENNRMYDTKLGDSGLYYNSVFLYKELTQWFDLNLPMDAGTSIRIVKLLVSFDKGKPIEYTPDSFVINTYVHKENPYEMMTSSISSDGSSYVRYKLLEDLTLRDFDSGYVGELLDIQINGVPYGDLLGTTFKAGDSLTIEVTPLDTFVGVIPYENIYNSFKIRLESVDGADSEIITPYYRQYHTADFFKLMQLVRGR